MDDEDSEGNFQFATLDCTMMIYLIYLTIYYFDDEESEYDSDEDLEYEENVQDTEYETD